LKQYVGKLPFGCPYCDKRYEVALDKDGKVKYKPEHPSKRDNVYKVNKDGTVTVSKMSPEAITITKTS
jgi:hypothetical protein